MLAALVSLALLGVVIVKYGLGDDAPKPKTSEPHVGTQHHTAELPGNGAKPAHEGGQLAPIQVYANAKAGDWCAETTRTEATSIPATTTTGVTRIARADDTRVFRTSAGRVEGERTVHRGGEGERPRQGLTIDQLVGNDVAGFPIFDLAMIDEDHTVGGRTFRAKKLTYSTNDPTVPGKRTRTELWISAEAPGCDVIESREVQEIANTAMVSTTTLIGFGNGDATTWGTKPAGM